MDVTKSKPGLITPWRNGYYRSNGIASFIFLVNGETCTTENASGKPTLDDPKSKGYWKYGGCGDAHPDIVKETGKLFYDIEMTLWGGLMKKHAVLSDDGTMLTCC